MICYEYHDEYANDVKNSCQVDPSRGPPPYHGGGPHLAGPLGYQHRAPAFLIASDKLTYGIYGFLACNTDKKKIVFYPIGNIVPDRVVMMRLLQKKVIKGMNNP